MTQILRPSTTAKNQQPGPAVIASIYVSGPAKRPNEHHHDIDQREDRINKGYQPILYGHGPGIMGCGFSHDWSGLIFAG
jgi:hypothetical protein